MSYVFNIDLKELSERQVQALHELGCLIHVPSNPLDDEAYTRLHWLLNFKDRLDLAEPRTFNEKLQWLKLRYRPPTMPSLVDKLTVRDFVAARVGPHVLNPLYGWGTSLREIDPATLPQSFIIKCTHGSGWNIPVPHKASVNWPTLVEQIDRWRAINYYDLRREWVYREIAPRVVVERLLSAPDPGGLLDYKFFCFGGRAHYLQVDVGRFTHHERNIYDIDWNRIPCELMYPKAARDVERPDNLHAMVEVAEALADGFPFVRVDLFNVAGEVTFGEMTFYPGNGFLPFTPENYDRVFGDLLELPVPYLEPR